MIFLLSEILLYQQRVLLLWQCFGKFISHIFKICSSSFIYHCHTIYQFHLSVTAISFGFISNKVTVLQFSKMCLLFVHLRIEFYLDGYTIFTGNTFYFSTFNDEIKWNNEFITKFVTHMADQSLVAF